MRNAWKLSWDIAAVIVGTILGWKVFLFSGSNIPTFGYFPIGVILGLLTLWVGAIVTHLVEGFLASIIYKVFGLRLVFYITHLYNTFSWYMEVTTNEYENEISSSLCQSSS